VATEKSQKIAGVVLSDDLTGAADTGIQFHTRFPETMLLSHRRIDRIPQDTLADVMAVFTDSRALDEKTARKRTLAAAGALAGYRPGFVYKKIDSCLRGNPGAEIEAALEGFGFQLSFIAPAFPEMGRTTVKGVHYVHGKPVAQTETARDPVTPVTKSSVVDLLSDQCRLPAGRVDIETLAEGTAAAAARVSRLAEEGARHIVFDAETRDHLNTIAELSVKPEFSAMPVGSAGLAESLQKHLVADSVEAFQTRHQLREGRFVWISGTLSETAVRQISLLCRNFPYEGLALSPEMLAAVSRRGELTEIADNVAALLGRRHLMITTERTSGEGPPVADREFSRQVAEGLAAFTSEILRRIRAACLYLSGGDTALAVLEALDVRAVRLKGELMKGVVFGAVKGGEFDGLPVVTKAGAFGKPDALARIHQLLRNMAKE
jgi:uncharacterized protein YgbK (DUF1537 family)